MNTNEFAEAKLQPSKPRQCMHWNSDGIRCRSHARHNEYTCFHHRITDEPSIPVIANDPFTLPPLNTREGVQEALTAVATHLAGKTIDDRRANLLLYTIQLASYQLPRPIQMPPEFPAPDQTLDVPAEAASQEPPALPQPPREYTSEERSYLVQWAAWNKEPDVRRPESISQEDIDAFIIHRKARIVAEEAASKFRKRKGCAGSLPSIQAVAATSTTRSRVTRPDSVRAGSRHVSTRPPIRQSCLRARLQPCRKHARKARYRSAEGWSGVQSTQRLNCLPSPRLRTILAYRVPYFVKT